MSDDKEWQPLTEKYRPKTTSDVQGNNKAIAFLKGWVEDFTPGDEPQLLHGRPGVGKSSTVQAIGNDLDIPVKEINASDARRTAEVAEFVEEAQSTPYDNDTQIVMMDEADSMSGRTNFSPLYDLLDNPPNPIVVICNDLYEVPDGIKNRCNHHKFNLGVRSRKAKLREIVQNEGLNYGASTISLLAQRENLRDAISDLQALALTNDDIAGENERAYETSLFDEIDNVRIGEPTQLRSEDPEKTALWIDRNLRDRWRLVEAVAAWDALSRADMLNARVWGRGDPRYRWWKWSGAIEEQIPYLRLSSAYTGYVKTHSPDYYGWDDIDKSKKNLYEKLSTGRTDSFEMASGLYEFTTRVLPILQELDDEEKFELALNYGLEDGEIEELGVDSEGYEDWRTGKNRVIGSQEQNTSNSSFMEW